ncbi:neuroblastoma-amplified sequence [Orycteropus afer afer]|uniref:Neuroblastoma-amplified sequence n=1 Tax=Orycteropus afer afer TaxID=1230840 RepID=A0AC54ZBP8_ORYAF|nr:neuroblastoma-amplified sequence [Orycteropus afer afer]
MAAPELGQASISGSASPEGEEETILYDLLVNTEWPPETEVQPRGSRKHGASFIITKAIRDRLLFLRQYIWYSPVPFLLPDGLVRLVNKQINWHLALASNGKLLAAVQDQCVEIRSAKDDFTSIIGKCQVPKDPKPQWRRVAWSYDCTLLAYAESTGTVRVFDLMGSELFVISPASSFAGDLSYAIAGLIFLEYKASAQWSAELLVINYRGELRSYLVSVGTNQSYQESHSFSFNSYYPHGINTAIYHPGHRLLLVGGCETAEVGISKASSCGLSAWRVLSGSPYYKQVTNGGDRVTTVPKTLGLLRMLSMKFYNRQGQEQDGIFKMSLSPDGTLLAAIHFSGKLSIWAIPSLKQQGEWNQNEQPGYDDLNPDWRLFAEKRKKIKDKESFYPLIDVNWWADSAVTLARCSGALTVSSVKTLKNLLGRSCEWFEPSPQVTATHDGGFLTLECEIKLAPKRSRLETRSGEDDEGEEDSDSDHEISAKARYFGYIKQGLYLVTEMERFAPPRKRPRAITKNYRLVSLRSTTPEELYQRKIESEEYEEALSLAYTYGLDTDLVYQRQWRKSAVNIASIQNYLSKIKKRSWVLHECLERVPENVDAVKELLQYGLKGTDLEALVGIGKGVDDGRFTLPGEVDIDSISYEELSPDEEEPAKSKKEKELMKRHELLKLVDFSKLTLEQKELCRCRLKLLTYLDRLATYEEILGVPHASEQRYDSEFFKKFRNQNIVLSARTYARESNVQALEILFTYHGSDLLPHRLAILSNFPETTSPHEYSVLLPEACFCDDALMIIPWHEHKHRDKDWCEESECKMVVEPNLQGENEFLYAAQPELLKYKTTQLTVENVTEWYQTRAEEIEHYAQQVDCSLSLIRLGMERSIPGLLVLCDNLVTLETLVYEAGCDLTLTLKELQQMKDIEKLRLLMNSCSEDKYVTSAYQWLVPFLHRCEKQSPGVANELLKEYLVTLAKGDLKFPLKIFQHSKPDLQQKIIPDQDQLMAIALECIYNCERNDQLSLCYDILECLPQRGYGHKTKVTTALHDMVDQLEQILSVAELLEKHGLEKPISFVKNTQSSSEEARKLMVRLTRHAGRKQPPVSESYWRTLLQDMLAMQQSVYTCLDSDACYEIFTESLLCSSHLENIHLAGQMMHCTASSINPPASIAHKGKTQYRVSYEKSIDLVLAASKEYFNSSTNLTDSCMDLARCCLQLITDRPTAIQEELDLIQALGCLEEFGVKILPLQVRLFSDRIGLIKECISQSPTCYKQSAKLLGLAELLRVAGDNSEERRGRILILLVEQALHFHDYKAATMHCQELMATGFSKSWGVCSQLGQSEGYQDVATRRELMAFALTHCPPTSIEHLLAASISLQTEILYQRLNFQIHAEGEKNINISPLISKALQEDEVSVPGSNSADLLHWTTATTMKVLSNTTTTTKAVLQAVSDGQWWKKSLTYLRPLQGQEFGGTHHIGNIANENLEKQGCHPFYESVLSNPFVTESEGTYNTYQHIPIESFAEVLLRTGKLAETKTEGEEVFPTTEVLLQLASDALPNDMTLALAYLLALPQVLDANKCFEKQSHSALCLQLAAYYYSLQIYARLAPCFRDKCHPLYRADPKELIKMCLLHLHVRRTLEENVYSIALSLAQRYSVSRWEVFMTHLEFLFTDNTFVNQIANIDNRFTCGLLLSVEARTEMTRKAIKTVKHFIEKPRKRNSEGDIQEPGDSKVTYADTLTHLERSLAHLETLSHSFIVSLKNSEQEMLQKYSNLYDLSRSEKGKLHDQVVAMCLDGQPLRMIQQLLEVAVGPLDISPKDVVQSAIMKIISALSEGSVDLGGPQDPLQVLEGVVAAVRASVEKGEELVSSEELLEWLRPFCADDTLPVRPRIHVLQIVEQSFHLTEEDGKLLVFFRTEAILKAAWPQRQVDVTDIENEENRYSLFLELLESSYHEVDFQHLVLLLQAWPPVKSEYVTSLSSNPWMRLVTVMLTRCTVENKERLGNEALKICRSLYNTMQMLPAECVKELCLLLLNQSLLLPSLKLLLESQDENLHALALEHITAVAKVDNSNCDQELLSLLLDANLLVKCISTPFYPHIINHLLASLQQGRWDAEELARHLWEAGHEAEAGSLLLAIRGTHRALRTFSTALSTGQHWM